MTDSENPLADLDIQQAIDLRWTLRDIRAKRLTLSPIHRRNPSEEADRNGPRRNEGGSTGAHKCRIGCNSLKGAAPHRGKDDVREAVEGCQRSTAERGRTQFQWFVLALIAFMGQHSCMGDAADRRRVAAADSSNSAARYHPQNGKPRTSGLP